MIELSAIHKSFRQGMQQVPVLKGIDVDIARGEFMAIMGPSGSGKSTLMNILGCLDTFDQGRYRLDGQAIESLDPESLAGIRNRTFGFVFQLFNLIPKLSAVRNVELPMVYAHVPRIERRERAREALAAVGLAQRIDHAPSELSGGQQQRVAIARAIVNDPQVIIADEPTGSLDSASGTEIMAIFHRLHDQGKTLIMVTHDAEIAGHASRILRLRDGRIEEDRRS